MAKSKKSEVEKVAKKSDVEKAFENPDLIDPEHELNPDAYRVDDEPEPEEGWDKAGVPDGK